VIAAHPPGLDLDRLRAYLDGAVPGLLAGPLQGQVLAGGRSNLTYLVGDGATRWVVRRPPLGHVLATAHDMAREYTVMAALAATPVPVPRMTHLCADPDVIGAPFYLMEYVEGDVLRDPAELDRLGPAAVRALVLSTVDVLADLHAVPPDSVGLADFGRPEGFNERQVRRWKRQLDASHSRDVPGIEQLHARLAAAVPDCVGPAIVHGDYRLDNLVVGADHRIRAVLDWEMSTLGDPLADVALMVVYAGRPMPSSRGLDRAPLSVPGHPSTGELVDRYAERSGRDLSRLRWYVAFAAFKLAVILEGVHYRYVRGQTVGEGFERMGEAVAPLVAQGHRTLDQEPQGAH
jgi:aminoglycoside phosphotransferase (APT) family kinase protein